MMNARYAIKSMSEGKIVMLVDLVHVESKVRWYAMVTRVQISSQTAYFES